MRELFDRWERVWHERQYDLVPGCVAGSLVHHEGGGPRCVTPEACALEIATTHRARPNSRFLVHAHAFIGDRAWGRFTHTWADVATGEPRTRAGLQLYRVQDGKLAESWLTLLEPGATWPDGAAHDGWTGAHLN